MHNRFYPHSQTASRTLDTVQRSNVFGWRILTCLVVACLTLPAVAQDDPFGGASDAPAAGDDPFGAAGDTPAVGADTTEVTEQPAPRPRTTPAADEPLVIENIIVRMFREEPPKDALEVGRAILLISRLKDWPEVGRYLDQLAPLSANPQVAEALVQRYGTQLWMQLAAQTALSEPQRLTARKILDSVTEARTAPQTIQEAINGLKSEVPVERKRAALRLQQAGSRGLLAVVNAVGDGHLPASPIVVDLIDSYGSSGVDALSASLTTSDAAVRSRVLFAACAFVGKGLLSQLSTAIHDQSVTADVRKAIEDVFVSRGRGTPTIPQVRNYLKNEIARELNLYRVTPRDGDAEDLVWLWLRNTKTGALEVVQSNASTYFLQKAAEKSIALLQSQKAVDEASILAAAALLQRDYAINQFVDTDPLNLRTQSPLGDRAALFGDLASDLGYWVSVYRTAEANELYSAQLRSIQQIGRLPLQNHLNGDALNAVLDASASTVPAVRYAALEVLMRLKAPSIPAQVTTALETARARQTKFVGFPTALVIGGAPELRQTAINQLVDLGIESIEAASGREAVRQIQRFTPLEFVFVVDRIADMPVSELVQRISAYPPTSAISVGILTPNVTDSERVVLQETPGLVYGTLTSKENYMQSVLRRMNSLADIPLPSQSDRLVWTGMLRD